MAVIKLIDPKYTTEEQNIYWASAGIAPVRIYKIKSTYIGKELYLIRLI